MTREAVDITCLNGGRRYVTITEERGLIAPLVMVPTRHGRHKMWQIDKRGRKMRLVYIIFL